MNNRIAFLGVGIMGKGIVKNYQKLNIPLSLYARNIEKIKNLENTNTRIYNNPIDTIKDSTHIILCLTEDNVVSRVYDEIASITDSIIIDFGTTSPGLTSKLYQNQKNQGKKFISSPMTGSKIASERGEIVFMIGADSEQDIVDNNFIWKYTGKTTIYCGLPEIAQKAKIALNLTQALLLQSYLEGSILAESVGVSRTLYQEIISLSAAKSAISDFKLKCINEENYEPNFSLKNMNKDLNHALSMAIDSNLSLPLSYITKTIYNEGMRKNLGEEDFVTLYKINRERNRINGN